MRGSALDFVRRNRSKLWPGVPVVFSGVPEEELSPSPEAGIVGVPMRFSSSPEVGISRGTPKLGEDEDYVYGELLGISLAERKRLTEAQVIF